MRSLVCEYKKTSEKSEDLSENSSDTPQDPTCSSPSLDTSCVSSERPYGSHPFRNAVCSNCGSWIPIPIWCGDRLCPICARHRQIKYQTYLLKKAQTLENLKNLRFITFTGKTCTTLKEAFNDLKSAIKKLKDRDIWKKNIIGGAYSFEVCKTWEGWDIRTKKFIFAQWYVHIHIVAEGNYIPQKKLSEAWKSVTNSKSYVVDIRKIYSYSSFQKELSKYPFKPSDSEYWNDEIKKEFNDFMYKRRLFTKFGSWYNDHISLADHHTICPYCGAVDSFIFILNDDFTPEKDGVDRAKIVAIDSVSYRPLAPLKSSDYSLKQCLDFLSL